MVICLLSPLPFPSVTSPFWITLIKTKQQKDLIHPSNSTSDAAKNIWITPLSWKSLREKLIFQTTFFELLPSNHLPLLQNLKLFQKVKKAQKVFHMKQLGAKLTTSTLWWIQSEADSIGKCYFQSWGRCSSILLLNLLKTLLSLWAIVASDSISLMQNSVWVLKVVSGLTKAHNRERSPAALAELPPDSNTPKSTYPYASLQPGCQTLLGKSGSLKVYLFLFR